LAIPDASVSEAGAATGATIRHAPASFFRFVTSPDSDFTVSSSILSASRLAKTLSSAAVSSIGFEATK
jgi:hypothetical protein